MGLLAALVLTVNSMDISASFLPRKHYPIYLEALSRLWKVDHEAPPYNFSINIEDVRSDIQRRMDKASYEIVGLFADGEMVGFVSCRSFNDNRPYVDIYDDYLDADKTGMVGIAAILPKYRGLGLTTKGYEVLIPHMAKKYETIAARVVVGDYSSNWREPDGYYKKIGFEHAKFPVDDITHKYRTESGKPVKVERKYNLMIYSGE